MTRPVLIDLFVEDSAHERLLLPLIHRIATGEGKSIQIQVRSARGGHAKAIEEMRKIQDLIADGFAGIPMPTLFLVGIDGNCSTAAEKKKAIRAATRPEFSDRLVLACPDPHIERWYMADPDSFQALIGLRPVVGKEKCQRDHYKHLLASTVSKAGHPSTLQGLEWAEEIVEAMDLSRASTLDPELGRFLTDLRGMLRTAR